MPTHTVSPFSEHCFHDEFLLRCVITIATTQTPFAAFLVLSQTTPNRKSLPCRIVKIDAFFSSSSDAIPFKPSRTKFRYATTRTWSSFWSVSFSR